MRVSISQITTVSQSFADDLDAYRAAGADGIGIWEHKLEEDSLERFRATGLEAAAAVPAVPSILPLPLMEGPADPSERVEAICAGIRRLAPFEPACVLFLTGPGDDRGAVAEGIAAIADEGRRAGVRVALEPIQREFREYWTTVVSLDEAAALLEEAGRPDVGLVLDTWHLWNAPGLLDEIERHRDLILALHVADWREPTRNTNDRVLPGDVTDEAYADGEYTPITSWAETPLDAVVHVDPEAVEVVATTPGLEKRLHFDADGRLTVVYRWHPASFPAGAYFAPEISLAHPLELTCSPQAETWSFVITTVSKSERGLDETIQGRSLTPRWPVRVGQARVELGG